MFICNLSLYYVYCRLEDVLGDITKRFDFVKNATVTNMTNTPWGVTADLAFVVTNEKVSLLFLLRQCKKYDVLIVR